MKKKIGSALVVGAGISGIRSALDLAETGYRVTLVDRAPNLGGTLMQLDYQFPSDHCGMCKMLPMVERDASSQYCLRKGLFHENIDMLLSTELVGLEGEPGKFQATLRCKPSMVDSERCIGCGECSQVCPVEVPDAFNAGLTRRKAIYLPVPHTIPNSYVVDVNACNRCGECQRICPTGAIDLRLEARKSFRILVVDDELIVRDSIKEWLDVEGFSVDMAESGMEALDALARQEYHLMLLDVKMPGMDGVEVLKRGKEMHPELPVIMMTAYATVETAVEAMKVGARDYLMKPFDPESLVSMVVQLYMSTQKIGEHTMEVGAVILSAGFESYCPTLGRNNFGYGDLPNVVTSIEFERLVSGTGPNAGKLLRPSDGREVRKIAWLQCAGSRDVKLNADYCSSVCCMFAIKEAQLAKERTGGCVDATIFYMDMRTFGKNFQRYRDRAEKELGIRFCRSRVHSVEPGGTVGDLRIYYAGIDGEVHDDEFDLVVLAAGQRPPAGTQALAERLGIDLNPWGFCQVRDFSLTQTSREGIFVGGSFSGLRDISESVVQASAASLGASRLLHSKGGSLADASAPQASFRDVSREIPRVAVVLCTCSGALEEASNMSMLTSELKALDAVSQVIQVERLCTQEGWSSLRDSLVAGRANRVLLGACLPYVYGRKVRELGREIGLDPALIEIADVRKLALPWRDESKTHVARDILSILSMGVGRLKGMDATRPSKRLIVQRALVVGGGIAGMTAALAIADHGFDVALVERAGELGGNLRSIYRTLGGGSPQDLLTATVKSVEKHPQIKVYTNARVVHSQGSVGRFLTTIEKEDGGAEVIDHGVAVLATGGREASTESYGYGLSDSIVTQHELERKLHEGSLDPCGLQVAAMIQCVDSREEPRNYCSRICCSSALKNALFIKEKNSEADVYVFYRDMMSYGFMETYYTRARQAGVIFIQYGGAEGKPRVVVNEGKPEITAFDPILGRDIALKPDLLVLSTGIVSEGQRELGEMFGVEVNQDGFFQEAESKWRPVDFLKEGVFLCGIAHSPLSIPESIATAEAAAQRALRILDQRELAAGSMVAEVRQSLCALCERCVVACPYGARWLDEDEEKIVVDELMCQGCGSCVTVCPNSASVLRGYRNQQMFAVIDAALEGIF